MCSNSQNSVEHKVVIENDEVTPKHTTAALCDKLTITSLDDKPRRVAFGKHEKHIAYDGVEEKLLVKGRSFTVTLRESGEYLFHDHNQEEVQGTFEVGN